jgi:hypothetical protein
MPSSLFAPSEDMIFPLDPAAITQSIPMEFLSDEMTISLAEKYRFVHRLKSFANRLAKIQQQQQRKQVKAGRGQQQQSDTIASSSVDASQSVSEILNPSEASKHRQLFDRCEGQLKGNKVYQLIKEQQATSSGRSIRKEQLVGEEYVRSLCEQSCNVDTEIEKRIIRPLGISNNVSCCCFSRIYVECKLALLCRHC